MQALAVVVFAAMACLVSGGRYWSATSDKLCRSDPILCEHMGRLGGHPGEITWTKNAGKGQVFGTLGSTDQGLLGQAGYKQTIFNDARGKFDASAYGTRVLNPAGDSSHLGGKLDWSNKDASASVDVSKQIGGPTSVSATGAGKWHPSKNTEVSAGATLTHGGHGSPDVTVEAKIEHKF